MSQVNLDSCNIYSRPHFERKVLENEGKETFEKEFESKIEKRF